MALSQDGSDKEKLIIALGFIKSINVDEVQPHITGELKRFMEFMTLSADPQSNQLLSDSIMEMDDHEVQDRIKQIETFGKRW